MERRSITLDLHYLGREGIISAFAAPTGGGGFVLLDTGPASTLAALEQGLAAAGLALDGLRAVLLTHIHLDHAAAAGTLARRTGCEVWAHPAGIDHLADPGAKLLPSALRLYGERLEKLFGTMEPVPRELLRPVAHGAPVRIGERTAVGWQTPGHARHHVAWQLDDEVATGDVAGVRLGGSPHVLPPMPPPDIDVEAWLASLELVRGLEPRRLLLTHFGGFDDPDRHLAELAGRLQRWATEAMDVVRADGDASGLAVRLDDLDEHEMELAGVSAESRVLYRRLCPMEENAAGLFRYAVKASHAEG